MKPFLSALIDRFQAKFPPNRLTALAMGALIPLVITPAAAFLAVWIPAHFPGLPTFTAAQLTAYGILGGSAALLGGITAGYKFIDGCQKDEKNQLELALEEARLESKERIVIAERAASPWEALDALGGLHDGQAPTTPARRSDWAAAIGSLAPPMPPSPDSDLSQEDVAAPSPSAPPVPAPPHEAAREAAQDAPPQG